MSNLRERLKENYGHFEDTELDDMIVEFGDNFEVVVKFNSRDRIIISLKKLKNMSKFLYDDVREVYIPSDVYRSMFN